MVPAWKLVCGRFINFKESRQILTLLTFGCRSNDLLSVLRCYGSPFFCSPPSNGEAPARSIDDDDRCPKRFQKIVLNFVLNALLWFLVGKFQEDTHNSLHLLKNAALYGNGTKIVLAVNFAGAEITLLLRYCHVLIAVVVDNRIICTILLMWRYWKRYIVVSRVLWWLYLEAAYTVFIRV